MRRSFAPRFARHLGAALVAFALAVLVQSPSHAAQENWATRAARQLTERGNGQWTRRDTSQALSSYTEAVRMDPSYGPAYLALGQLREAMGDHREADRVFSLGIIRAEPGRAQLLAARAFLRYRQDDASRAMRDLQAACNDAAAPLEWHRTLAGWYVKDRAWGAALVRWRFLKDAYQRGNFHAQAKHAHLQVLALQALAAELDPIRAGRSRNWVRNSLSSIAQRGG